MLKMNNFRGDVTDVSAEKDALRMTGVGGVQIDRMRETWECETSNAGMPQFSTYASAYATAVGEYLIMLPQQLEVLVPEDSDPDADTPAARWLDKTASAVAEALASKVLSLPKLGAQVCCCLKLANRQIGKVGKINKVHVNKLVDVDAFFAECNVADTSVRSPAKRNFVYCTSKGGSLGESAM